MTNGAGGRPIRKGTHMSETTARKEWSRNNTTQISLKLNNKTDLDILTALSDKQKQTEIKRLIREGLKAVSAP